LTRAINIILKDSNTNTLASTTFLGTQIEYTWSFPPVAGVLSVRIQLVGTNILSLAEVEVYPHSGDVALGQSATQSSTPYLGQVPDGVAGRGVDGNNGGDFFGNSITHTSPDSSTNSWKVDLGADYSVSKVVVYNRIEC